MIKLEMKNYNIFIEKLKKYQLYHPAKLISINILPFNQQQITEQAKLTYSPLRKAFEKQTKEQVKAIKDLDFSDKAS